MKPSRLKTTIIAVIALVAGFVFGLTWHNWQEAKNEAPENGVESYGFVAEAGYVEQSSFISSYYSQPTTYAPDYDAKNRCRVEYFFQGGADNTKPLDILIDVQQAPGTPGGTSAKGAGELRDFEVHRYKVVANHELSLEQIKKLVDPPQGWDVKPENWSSDKRFAPFARKTFENCVDEVQTPKR